MSDTRSRLFGRPGELLVDEDSPRIRMPAPPPGPWVDEEPSGPNARVDEATAEVNTGPLRVMVGPAMAQLGPRSAELRPRPEPPFEALELSEPPRPGPPRAPSAATRVESPFDALEVSEPPRPRVAAKVASPALRVEPVLPKGPGIATAAARRKAEAKRAADSHRIEEIPMEVFDVPRADLTAPVATLLADREPTPARVLVDDLRPLPESRPPSPIAEQTFPPSAPLFTELSDPLPPVPPTRPPAYREAAPVRLPATAAAQRRRRVLLAVGFTVVLLGLAVSAKLQLALWRDRHPRPPEPTAPIASPPVEPAVSEAAPLIEPPAGAPPVAEPIAAAAEVPASPVESPPPPAADPSTAVPTSAPAAPTAVTRPAVVTLAQRQPTSTQPATAPTPVTAPTAKTTTAAASVEISRPKGLLMVVSDRKGVVYVDDVRKGTTTDARPMELLAGTHRVKVVAGGRTRTMEVRVDADQVRMVEFRFSR